MHKAIWLDTINQEKIIQYKKLTGGVSSEVYYVKTIMPNLLIK